jgi:hypothetical protein
MFFKQKNIYKNPAKKKHMELSKRIIGDLENTNSEAFCVARPRLSEDGIDGWCPMGCSPPVIKHGWKMPPIYG